MKYEINKDVFTEFPTLESERLIYRELTSTDSEALFFIRTNKDVMKYMDSDMLNSITESENLIKSIKESFNLGSAITWGISEKHSNKLIGYFGYWRIDLKHCRGEIGYALHPGYWGKGYMKECINKLVEFGFSKLNLHSIEANVNPDNLQSIKLLEKIGFRKEAYYRENYLFNNEFKDSVIFSLLERDLFDKKLNC